MRVKFPKNNKFTYGQDFSFWRGIPSGIEFEVEDRDEVYVLRGKGYGAKDYGNGALYLHKKQDFQFDMNDFEVTRLPDISNQKINKYAGAMEALAKGDEMTDELKPCPFCGSLNIFDDVGLLTCGKCGVTQPKGDWNTRPLEDALRAQLAVRDALIERLVEAGYNLTDEHTELYYPKDVIAFRALVAEWQAMKGGEK